MQTNYLTGLFTDMTSDEYHSHTHIGSSGFKRLEKSPLHFWHGSPLNTAKKREPKSRIMVMGTAWHTGIWEPHLFEETYAAKPDINAQKTEYKILMDVLEGGIELLGRKYVQLPEGLGKTTKAGKELIAEIEAHGLQAVEHEVYQWVADTAPSLMGRTLLSADDLQHVRDMAAAASANRVTRAIFNLPGGMREASLFWVDQRTGAPCKVRFDYAVKPCQMFPNGLIVDGKSNDDSSPEHFSRAAYTGSMYYQAAFYSDGFQQHFGTSEPPVFAWLAQEREAPHANAYYSAPPDFVEYGRRRYRPLLAVFAECLRSGQWPGYSTEVQSLQLPAWAAREIDQLVNV